MGSSHYGVDRDPVRLQPESRNPRSGDIARPFKAERVSYTIKKRVSARTEAEARALLNAAAVRTTARNGSGQYHPGTTDASPVNAEMELRSRPDLR